MHFKFLLQEKLFLVEYIIVKKGNNTNPPYLYNYASKIILITEIQFR